MKFDILIRFDYYCFIGSRSSILQLLETGLMVSDMLKDPIPNKSVELKNGFTASTDDWGLWVWLKLTPLRLLLFRVLILVASLGGSSGGAGSIVNGDWGPLLFCGCNFQVKLSIGNSIQKHIELLPEDHCLAMFLLDQIHHHQCLHVG